MESLSEFRRIISRAYPDEKRLFDFGNHGALITFLGGEDNFLQRVAAIDARYQAQIAKALLEYFIETKPKLFGNKKLSSIDTESIGSDTLDEGEASALSYVFLIGMRVQQEEKKLDIALTLGNRHIEYLDAIKKKMGTPWAQWLARVRKAYTYDHMGTLYKKKQDFANTLKYKRWALRYVPFIEDDEAQSRLRGYIYDYISSVYREKGDYARYLQYKSMACSELKHLPIDQALRFVATEYDFMSGALFKGLMPKKEYIDAYWRRINDYIDDCSKRASKVSPGILEQFELFSALKDCPLDAIHQLRLKSLRYYLIVFENMEEKRQFSREDNQALKQTIFFCRILRNACKNDDLSENTKETAIELFFGGAEPSDFKGAFIQFVIDAQLSVEAFVKKRGLDRTYIIGPPEGHRQPLRP